MPDRRLQPNGSLALPRMYPRSHRGRLRGVLAAIAVGLSFGLTVLFFGFVVLAGLLLMVVG